MKSPQRGTRPRATSSSTSSEIVLNDVLIWVLVPALSYLAGALFQAGYNHYFGLPDELVSADPVAIFQASRHYQDLVIHHFSVAIALPLALLVYLTVLSNAFYRAHGITVLVLAAVALFVSFGVRPYVWALVVALILVGLQLWPWSSPPEHLKRTNPVAVKALAIVAFLYATLFAAGYDSGRSERQFFVSDQGERYVMLVIHDTVIVSAKLLDPACKTVTSLPDVLDGYHFDNRIKAFTLGDTDTPSFRVYQTSGLTPKAACGSKQAPLNNLLPAPLL